jgi:hypothetical protein
MWNNDDKGAMRQPLLPSSSTSHGPHVVNDLHDRVELAHHVDDGDAQRDGHSASQRDGHSAWVGGGSDSSKGTCEVSSAPFCLHTLHTDTVAAVHLPQSHRTSPIGTLQYICTCDDERCGTAWHCIRARMHEWRDTSHAHTRVAWLALRLCHLHHVAAT